MMAKRDALKKLALIALAGSSIAALVSCGNTGGGSAGDQTYDGTSFVSTDQSAGSMSITVNEALLPVGETTGFSVRVLDRNSSPVPAIQIACDTEQGLALIEPSSGFELTDGDGQMSGRVGCAGPGSYQIGCRLPVGANRRVFQTVRCQGPTPSGFAGFPGAGGGTLGTGTGSGGSSGGLGGAVTITSVVPNENNAATQSVDVVRGTCGTATEPFTDTTLSITVTNGTNSTINFSRYVFALNNAEFGQPFESSELTLLNGGDLAPGATKTYTALFLRAVGGRKVFVSGDEPIAADTGFRTVTIYLFGVDSVGGNTTVKTRVGMAFGDYNKCAS